MLVAYSAVNHDWPTVLLELLCPPCRRWSARLSTRTQSGGKRSREPNTSTMRRWKRYGLLFPIMSDQRSRSYRYGVFANVFLLPLYHSLALLVPICLEKSSRSPFARVQSKRIRCLSRHCGCRLVPKSPRTLVVRVQTKHRTLVCVTFVCQ